MLVSTRKIKVISFFVLISAICNASFVYVNITYDYDNWIRIIPIIVFIQMLLCLYCFRLVRVPLFSLSFMFIFLSYLFHFGEVIAFGVFNYSGVANHILLYPTTIYKNAIYSCFIIINCIALGIMLSSNHVSKDDHNELKDKQLDITHNLKTRNSWILGLIILFLTFPLRLYIDIGNVLTGMREGYLSTYDKMMPGVIYSFSELYIIGLSLLLLSTRHQVKKQKAIFIVMVLYLILTMFSGHRIDAVIYIITLSYIYFMSRDNRKKGNLIKLCAIVLFAYLAIAFLLTISTIRNASNIDFNTVINVFLYYISINSNAIPHFLYEFGGTVYTPIATLYYVTEFSKYNYGLTYLLSFVNVFPNMGGIFTAISQKAMYGLELQRSGVLFGTQNIGGSFIGELIFNFGSFSALISLFAGMIIQKISANISHKVKNMDYLAIAYYLPVFWGILGLVRGYFSASVRAVVWGMLLVFVIKTLVFKSKSNGK